MFVAVLDDFDLYLKFIFVDMSVHILMMYLKFVFVVKPEDRWKSELWTVLLIWSGKIIFNFFNENDKTWWVVAHNKDEWRKLSCEFVQRYSSTFHVPDEFSGLSMNELRAYWTWPALEWGRFAVVDTSVMKKISSKLTIVLLMVAFYSCVSHDWTDPLQLAATVDMTSCKRTVEHQTNSQTWINTHWTN